MVTLWIVVMTILVVAHAMVDEYTHSQVTPIEGSTTMNTDMPQSAQTVLWFPVTHPKWDEDGWARPYGEGNIWWFSGTGGYSALVKRDDISLTGHAVEVVYDIRMTEAPRG